MNQSLPSETERPLRFVHCADLHLDSPPAGVAGHNVPFRKASRLALERIVDTCLSEGVDFLLIAGDLYDRDLQDNAPLVFFNQQMQRLAEHDVPVFMIRGNHDAANKAIGGLLAPNVHLFLPGQPQTEERVIAGQRVAIHGWSYAQESEPDFKLASYPEPSADAVNIGLLHTALEPQGPYAPCSEAELFAKGYDYWALGHAHIEKIREQGACLIVNPGMPQGRAIDEEGSKGAYLVDLEPGQPPQGRFFKTSSLDWQRVAIKAQGLTSVNDLERLIRRSLEALINQGDGERWACRLVVEDAEPALYAQRYTLIDAMTRMFDASFEERIFIERVVVRAREVGRRLEPSVTYAALAPFVQDLELHAELMALQEPLAKTLGAWGGELDLAQLVSALAEGRADEALDQALRFGLETNEGEG